MRIIFLVVFHVFDNAGSSREIFVDFCSATIVNEGSTVFLRNSRYLYSGKSKREEKNCQRKKIRVFLGNFQYLSNISGAGVHLSGAPRASVLQKHSSKQLPPFCLSLQSRR